MIGQTNNFGRQKNMQKKFKATNIKKFVLT